MTIRPQLQRLGIIGGCGFLVFAAVAVAGLFQAASAAVVAGVGLLVFLAVAVLSWLTTQEIATDAGQLAESEKSLRYQAFLLESVLTGMAEAVVAVDSSGRTLVWNAGAERLFGPRPVDGAKGDWASSVGLQLADGAPCPPDRSPLSQAIRGEQSHAELQLKNPRHETTRWLEVSVAPMKDNAGAPAGGVTVFRDITARKANSAERQQEEQEFRHTSRALRMLSRYTAALVHAESEDALLEEALSIVVEQGGYQLAVAGFTDADAPGSIRPVKSVTDASAIRIEADGDLNLMGQAVRDNMSAATGAGGPDLAAESASRASGSLLSVPLEAAGEKIGALSVWSAASNAIDPKEAKLIEDIATCLASGVLALRLDQKRLEMAAAVEQAKAETEVRVKKGMAEVVAVKEAAELADRLKATFLATMSHELRTPLNSIIGFTGLILQELAGPLTAEQKKQLGMVQLSARHLLDLITDILDLSRIECGQLGLRSESFDIRHSVDNVVRSVQPQADAKGLRLRSAVAPTATTITGDRRRVEQVLLNLLGNAIKFTDTGEVSIACSVDAGWFTASVRDTGPGIAAGDMVHLFRPFSQIETGPGRRHEGTGLGLSICRKLAEAMGGAVTVESAPAQGSTFTFRFPGGAAA